MVGLLIRHGHADPVGRWIAGRQEGIPLSPLGREEAEHLAAALRWLPLSAVYSSPLNRALQTAEPLARDHGLAVELAPAFTDVDFGAWTGLTLAELDGRPEWRAFNRSRRDACPPGGEALVAVQRRVVDMLLSLARRHSGEMIAVVTHAEPIRCAIAAFESLSLDDVAGIEIAPASVSTIGIEPAIRRVLAINDVAEAV